MKCLQYLISFLLIGVPSTLNKVVMLNGQPVLQPFPSWDWQDLVTGTPLSFNLHH